MQFPIRFLLLIPQVGQVFILEVSLNGPVLCNSFIDKGMGFLPLTLNKYVK